MLRKDMVCADSLARPVVALRGGPLAARIGVNAIVRQVFAVPLSPPAARSHLHDRRVVFRGYRRGDGLWDIEAELHDSKTQDFVLPGEGRWAAGEPIHGMAIRLTVDDDTVVHAIEVATTPPCPTATTRPCTPPTGARSTASLRLSACSALNPCAATTPPAWCSRRWACGRVGQPSLGGGRAPVDQLDRRQPRSARFDAPDDFRIDRDPALNLLYGAGIHVCPGAPLARLELRVLMEELLARATDIVLVEGLTSARAVYPDAGYATLRIRLR